MLSTTAECISDDGIRSPNASPLANNNLAGLPFAISNSICSKASLPIIFLAADLEIIASATMVFFPATVKLL